MYKTSLGPLMKEKKVKRYSEKDGHISKGKPFDFLGLCTCLSLELVLSPKAPSPGDSCLPFSYV